MPLETVKNSPTADFSQASTAGDSPSKCDPPGKCSNVRAVFNMLLSAVGLGVVMLATVFARVGWIGGFLILAFSACVASFMIHKLHYGLTMQPNGKKLNSYEDLGAACFGKVGGALTAVSVHITMTLVCAALLKLLGEHFYKLYPGMSIKLWTLASGGIALPFTFLPSLHEVSYLAAVGVWAVLVLMVVIVVGGIQNVASGDADEYSHHLFNGDFMTVAVSIGNTILSFNTANTVPTLVRDMQRPQDFKKMSSAAYAVIFLIYLLIACSGYSGWGDKLLEDHASKNVLDMIAPSDNSSALGYICIAAVLVMALPHYIVLYLPIAASLEYTADAISGNNAILRRWLRVVARLSVLCVTLLLAIFVASLSTLIDIIGSLTMVMIVIFMPAIYYLQTRKMRVTDPSAWSPERKWDTLGVCGSIVVGLFCLVFGCADVVRSLSR